MVILYWKAPWQNTDCECKYVCNFDEAHLNGKLIFLSEYEPLKVRLNGSHREKHAYM